MPSKSLETWRTVRAKALNEIVAAHRMVGGTGRGRRFATQQLNHAYAVLLSSQFQGFCRNLHAECIEHLFGMVLPLNLADIVRQEFREWKKLDKGNPNPGNIGSDFGRFGLKFWDAVIQHDSQNANRKKELESLNEWRNAIAHQDFDTAKLGGVKTLRLSQVSQWRRACHTLAKSFDEVMSGYIQSITGTSPW